MKLSNPDFRPCLITPSMPVLLKTVGPMSICLVGYFGGIYRVGWQFGVSCLLCNEALLAVGGGY